MKSEEEPHGGRSGEEDQGIGPNPAPLLNTAPKDQAVPKDQAAQNGLAHQGEVVPQVEPPGQSAESPFWDWFTLLALGVLVYHILALWYRWMRPDPDFLGFSASVAELLAIASFIGLQTERGQAVADQVDNVIVLRSVLKTPQRTCFTVWGVALFAAAVLHLGSPQAAALYRQRGAEALEQGQYSMAIRRFDQAISLVPSDARAHYNLASAYESLNQAEQAIEEYQFALELDQSFWPTYNNLGRLYLSSKHDPDAALAVLFSGQRQAQSPLGEAVIGKNIAWAYLEKGLPRTALTALEDVLENLRSLWAQGQSVEVYLAEASRLIAMAQLQLDNVVEAKRAWQDGLGYALAVIESEACVAGGDQPPPDCLVAVRWIAEAREGLAILADGGTE